MRHEVLGITLADGDTTLCRRRVREVALAVGLDTHSRTRVATALNEVVRASQGPGTVLHVRFSLDDQASGPALVIDVEGGEPATVGLHAARRLIGSVEVRPGDRGGTTTILSEGLGGKVDVVSLTRQVRHDLVDSGPDPQRDATLIDEELVAALEAAVAGQQQSEALARELADTNRGVMALYAELQVRNEDLRAVNESRSRFLSAASHELRTPVNALRALLSLFDGEMPKGQDLVLQVGFLRKAAETLSSLIDDLLDLTKADSDRFELSLGEVAPEDIGAALRGMMRPLARQDCTLVVEDLSALPVLITDEGKVAQILRNLVSNALKYTDQGEVRVWGSRDSVTGGVLLGVTDTGMGVAATDLPLIFEEFFQVPSVLQSAIRGSGLGLPLSQRLARALGGSISVVSEPGRGSTFTLALPLFAPGTPPVRPRPAAGSVPLLIVDDDPAFRFLIRRLAHPFVGDIFEAGGVDEGRRSVAKSGPGLVFLDLAMPDGDGRALARELREEGVEGRHVVICTSTMLTVAEREELATWADAVVDKKVLDRALVEDLLTALAYRPVGHAAGLEP